MKSIEYLIDQKKKKKLEKNDQFFRGKKKKKLVKSDQFFSGEQYFSPTNNFTRIKLTPN